MLDRRTMLKAAAVSAAFAAHGAATAIAAAAAQSNPAATPAASQGSNTTMTTGALSSQRLETLHAMLSRHVESGYVPGLVAAVWRKGDLHVEALGSQAIGGAPMRRDSIFRVASITKPVTAAAAMILVEEGALRLDDPVDEFLPELADRKVLKAIDGPIDDTVAANRAITLRDLLTQRFGLGAIMIWPPKYPIQQAMAEAGVAPGPDLPADFMSPDEYMKRLGSLPLAAQPGEKWLYDTGMHVAGVLIARAAGKSLGDFLSERIFEPLGMKDTGFFVPEEKRDRLVTFYQPDHSTGTLAVRDRPDGLFSRPPAFESGSGGLVSTVDDYLAFARMLLGKGSLDGTRILSRASVEVMTADQLTDEQKSGDHAALFFGGNSGWGLGMAVALRRDNLWMSPGRFGWDGGYGTSAYTDPAEELIGLLFTQRMMDSPLPPPTFTDFWTGAYQAIQG